MLGFFIYLYFMNPIEGLLSRVQKIDVVKETRSVLNRNLYIARDLNKEQLREYGIDSNGQKLSKYQSSSYAMLKNTMNPAPGFGTPDLIFTGDFHRGFFAKMNSKSILYGSTDMKSDKLERKYGEDIFGLTTGNKKVFSKIVNEELNTIISRKILA